MASKVDDGGVEERLNSLLTQLQSEYAILEQIVYKNKNQHRRGSYFQYLMKVRRDLRLLQSVRLEEITVQDLPPMTSTVKYSSIEAFLEGSIHTWDQIQRKILDKYYPPAKATQVRRELSIMREGPSESMYDYMERFNALELSCYNLDVPEWMLVEYLLDGLRPLERMLLDAAAGGTVLNLTPSQVREFINETAESVQYRDEISRSDDTGRIKNVSQVDSNINQMANEIKELKEMLQKMMARQVSGVKPCELCGAASHKTDECPTLHEDDTVDVTVGNFQNFNNDSRPQQRQFRLEANGFSRRNEGGIQGNQGPPKNQNQAQLYRLSFQQQERYNNQNNQYPRKNYNQAGLSDGNLSKLEEVVKELATSVQNHQAKIDGTLAELSKHMSQLAATVSELKNDQEKLSSQTIPNPKRNVSALTVISGKKLEREQTDNSPASSETELIYIA